MRTLVSVGQERQEQVQELALDRKLALKDACKDVPHRGAACSEDFLHDPRSASCRRKNSWPKAARMLFHPGSARPVCREGP